MARVLITGASGYLGRRLGHTLHEGGHDIFGTGRGPRPEIPLAGWTTLDLSHDRDLAPLVRDLDVIVHLAAVPLQEATQDPAGTRAVQVAATRRLLDAARKADARFVLASSAQVYAAHGPLPQHEDLPLAPETEYAVAKAEAEDLVAAAAHAHGVDAVRLRPFNLYGPAHDGHPRPTVETRFLQALLMGRRPVVHGAEESRDFIHLDDAVRAFAAAIERPTPWRGEAVNVGSGVETGLADLARSMAALCGAAQVAPLVEQRVDVPRRMQADTTRARATLGIEPRIGLEDGLRALVDTYLHAEVHRGHA